MWRLPVATVAVLGSAFTVFTYFRTMPSYLMYPASRTPSAVAELQTAAVVAVVDVILLVVVALGTDDFPRD